MIGAIISLSIGVLMVAIVIGVVITIVNTIKNKGEKNIFQFKFLWPGYLYLISLVSLIGMLIGVSMILKSGFAKLAGPQFSYNMNYYNAVDTVDPEYSKPISEQDYYKDYDKLVVNGKTFYYDGNQTKRDMIQGLTLAFSMAILFAIHRYLTTKSDKNLSAVWNKSYIFLGLIITSLLSIILIPTSAYQTISYYVEGWTSILTKNLYSGFTPPGDALSAMIVIVPAWFVFIYKVNRLNKAK